VAIRVTGAEADTAAGTELPRRALIAPAAAGTEPPHRVPIAPAAAPAAAVVVAVGTTVAEVAPVGAAVAVGTMGVAEADLVAVGAVTTGSLSLPGVRWLSGELQVARSATPARAGTIHSLIG
jgi:hypothetical protein